MGALLPESWSNVAHMTADDFRHNEVSQVIKSDNVLRVEHVDEEAGVRTVLKESVPVQAGEVVDATIMRVAALRAFLREQVQRARAEDVLFSVHLKATMMKVSDPIIFGHVVETFLPEVFSEHGIALAEAGLSASNGLGAVLSGLDQLGEERAAQVRSAVERGLAEGPRLAMVDSDRGITNLHVPSDVIVDASMPA